ncbi:MAG: hypothetical protein ACJAYU_001400 [Bradymonadia bacterium]
MGRRVGGRLCSIVRWDLGEIARRRGGLGR